ncbi:TIGR03089 family protein [Arthrobacter sp. SX1312]|uniref:TIGR03089 family protein n=1 Tax=Arthrobacter sp. SX1312 TaxID=2058896 RepID=UPI000CE3B4D7|nr:TIGR03089 family protein [Arthrobacter sp. SX1312]
MPQTPGQLLTRMRTVNPTSPRLVWHGREGRIELSGRVFDNWVAKSSNLLVDELDAAGGTTVAVDLPVHWKTLALVFACWQVGAVVVLADDGTRSADPDIVLSSRTGVEVDPGRLLACVALGSLALRWEGPLPRGAVDYAAEVRSHGDVFLDAADGPGAPSAPLVRTDGRTLTAADLAGSVVLPTGPGRAAAADTAAAGSPTVLLEPGVDLLRALAAAFAVWERDGALVLVEEGVPVTERLLSGEKVTDRLGTA